MIDRGFVKWQPFNSLTNAHEILDNLPKKEDNPPLFPEEIDTITELIKIAYYEHEKVEITYYENNHFKTIKAYIINIFPVYNTIKLSNNKTIYFKQIHHLKELPE